MSKRKHEDDVATLALQQNSTESPKKRLKTVNNNNASIKSVERISKTILQYNSHHDSDLKDMIKIKLNDWLESKNINVLRDLIRSQSKLADYPEVHSGTIAGLFQLCDTHIFAGAIMKMLSIVKCSLEIVASTSLSKNHSNHQIRYIADPNAPETRKISRVALRVSIASLNDICEFNVQTKKLYGLAVRDRLCALQYILEREMYCLYNQLHAFITNTEPNKTRVNKFECAWLFDHSLTSTSKLKNRIKPGTFVKFSDDNTNVVSSEKTDVFSEKNVENWTYAKVLPSKKPSAKRIRCWIPKQPPESREQLVLFSRLVIISRQDYESIHSIEELSLDRGGGQDITKFTTFGQITSPPPSSLSMTRTVHLSAYRVPDVEDVTLQRTAPQSNGNVGVIVIDAAQANIIDDFMPPLEKV